MSFIRTIKKLFGKNNDNNEKEKEFVQKEINLPTNLLPEEISGQRIIALDFDDCIIPPIDMLESMGEEKFEQEIKENIDLILKVCENRGFSVFIISSWSAMLDLRDSELKLLIKENNTYNKVCFKQLKRLSPFVIGLSPYLNREEDIEIMKKNGNKIIVLDDMDLSHLADNKNVFYIESTGKIPINDFSRAVSILS